MNKKIKLIIVGSIGLDTIETPRHKKETILGGSLSYACLAASFFTKVGMVGVVGTDFPKKYVNLYKGFGVNMEGLQHVPGKTFRWHGVYDKDMINRRTVSTDLNVFAAFTPELPASYRDAEMVMLGNISPNLQIHVLDQMKKPRFVVADTMDLWINNARGTLVELIGRVDMLTLNDSEARLLTDKHNLKECARIIMKMGPKYVVIKKGEHGAILFWKEGTFIVPAYPLDEVMDPTGAGDSFAGAFMGCLAECGGRGADCIKTAMLHASVVASFGVEDFSVERFHKLDRKTIKKRVDELKKMIMPPR